MKDELVTILDQEARRTDFEGIWPERSIKSQAQHGLLGLTLPSSDSGQGAGMRQFAEVTERIAAHCASRQL